MTTTMMMLEDHSRGHLLHGASCEVLCGVSCKWIYGESCGLMRGVSCEVLCGASCKWIYGESCGLLLQSCCCGFRSCWHSALFIISSPFELLSPFPAQPCVPVVVLTMNMI